MIHDLLSGHTVSIGPVAPHRFSLNDTEPKRFIASCDCGWRYGYLYRRCGEDEAIRAALLHFNRSRRPDEAQLVLF